MKESEPLRVKQIKGLIIGSWLQDCNLVNQSMYDCCFCTWCWGLKFTWQEFRMERWIWSSVEKEQTGITEYSRTHNDKQAPLLISHCFQAFNFDNPVTIKQQLVPFLMELSMYLTQQLEMLMKESQWLADEELQAWLLPMPIRWASTPMSTCVNFDSTWAYNHLLIIKMVCRSFFGI